MPQSPLAFVATKVVNGANAVASGILDAVNTLMVSVGGRNVALNVTAKTVIKVGPGRAAKIMVITAPSAGVVAAYDATTVGAGVTATALYSVPFGSAAAASPVNLDAAFVNGLVVDPGTGGVVAVSYT